MPLLEEELNTAISEDTLLHGEALLVIATADTNHIALCVCVCTRVGCVCMCVGGLGVCVCVCVRLGVLCTILQNWNIYK